MRRVSVVGNSGSGKSTLARGLAERLGVPWIELDSIRHQPGWRELPDDEFTARVCAATAASAWVVDGNYSVVRALIWSRADTVVWLDPPRLTALRQVGWRTLSRVLLRRELWNGNRERWTSLFRLDRYESMIVWTWQRHPVYRRRYTDAMSAPEWSGLRFVRLPSRRAAERWLAAVRPEVSGR
jgi:adenylate kinase family enzyme